ncbi:MAG: valine--tRNA ligase [Sphingomonas sp.]|uniref:valine--tRNA ligase n=1 Tax=Sphingomonas sp. TaxID=28214 RepID=UPI003F2C371E
MTDLPKTFDPADIESRWYAHWENEGLFRPERPGAEPWTIVNPPPNVTGSLHIGHALDNTLQDILTRHARLKGKDALWVVGTDHAGIATQMVVERQMAERQDKRTNYTREEFVEKVWAWKRESGGQITQQLRRLGCSMDWANERFTMDPGFSKAVAKVFVDLYNQGLIYRDKRLVNWDPGLGTAISDLEVETHEVKGSFWHFRYPLADGVTLPDGTDHLIVATTRPETMLADMLVAVNGEDARYQSVIGQHVIQPITGRRLRIVADDHADPELGSGVVKITPGHDFNDFEVAKRAGIEAREMLNMFDAKAQVVQTADGLVPEAFLGLPRFKTDGVLGAREATVAWMKEHGFLVPHIDKEGAEHDAEPRTIQTPFGDRSGVVIEPWLTDQWYVDAATLAKAPIEAVKSGAIDIVPKTWEKTFFNWMDNIQPWCVSRQLWWGHRIPAWYGPKFLTTKNVHATEYDIVVAGSEPEAVQAATFHYSSVLVERREILILDSRPNADAYRRLIDTAFKGGPIPIWRDPDVLDTWFSSALWPFATLGWPDAPQNPPFVPSAVEGRATSDPSATRVSTSLDTNGSGVGQEPATDGSEHRKPTLHGRYPNDVLVSGFDILFFWDARMMMMGMHFMQDVPFRTLYLHGLVRAADGQKMSKSKGNTVDPLGLIDKYGADALRFFMAAMESQGRDIKMDERRVEGYRNFATKLWNAARFAQANGIGGSSSIAPPPATLAVNKWIIGEVVETVRAMDAALADYRFDGAANAIYHFVWDRFCDWYLELIKPVLSPLPLAGGAGGGPDADAGDAAAALPTPNPSRKREGDGEAAETRAVAGWVLDQILVLLHPFMPFVTEELWSKLGEREYELIVAKWPEVERIAVDEAAIGEIKRLVAVIEEVRAQRVTLEIAPGALLPTTLVLESDGDLYFVNKYQAVLQRIARLQAAWVTPGTGTALLGAAGDGFVVSDHIALAGHHVVRLDCKGLILVVAVQNYDAEAQRARLAKAIAAAEKERDSLASRLNNPSFVEKAKPEAVEKARADHAEKAAEAERLAAALARLG